MDGGSINYLSTCDFFIKITILKVTNILTYT